MPSQLTPEERSELAQSIAEFHTYHLGPGSCSSLHAQRIHAPPEIVWSVVRRFDKPQTYKHFIKSCSVEDGFEMRVGCTRAVNVISGLPANTSTERLDILDDERRVTGFSIIGGEHRLTNYKSVTTVHRFEKERRIWTVVLESYVVDMPEGNSEDDTRMFADTVVKLNLQKLATVTEAMARNAGDGSGAQSGHLLLWISGNLSFFGSTNLDSWSPEQLRTMMFGGNNRAQVFFKQHGWTDGGKIEAKYTSRAADLYRQLLAKEVAKAIAEDAAISLPSSPLAAEGSNGVSSFSVKEELPPKESFTVKQEATSSPKASNTVVPSTFKKPIGAKRTGKTGGLGARKLTTKPTGNLYEQKPEEVAPVIPAATSTNNGGTKSSGNSCFVNSVFQCLTHTLPLIESLCSYEPLEPCNCGNEWFCVRSAFKGHLEAALTTSRCSIAPYSFLNNLNYFSADFRRYQQEDAHEFLQAFLDKLERCCLEDPSSDRDPDDSVSSQDVNLVQRIFGGRLVSELRCCSCNSLSETFENSLGLSLEIEDVDNLQSALDSFTRVEKLDEPMTCDNCKEKVSKEKQLLLYKLPQVVTFHLKRFKNNGFFMEKIFNHVKFPLEIDLQPYMVRSQNNEVTAKYRLYAFVEHFGSLAYGHYSSYVRSAPKTWHQFDDKQVTRIDEDRVLSQDAYILFYAREGIPLFSSTFQEVHPLVEASLQNPSPNSVLDPTSGECSSEISYENAYKSNKLLYGTFLIQLEKLEATKNQEEEEPCKQPLLIRHVGESKENEIVHRRGPVKKPSPRERVLDQGISTTGSPPKKLKKA
ncbi:hypothetical protein F2Q70_00032734 [Brassica cretica]|uniref:ubiquitinyl hydrolase 1 n=1 Tax=Brassica cretica TaxID=69181 RepID=A0A8S9FF94_BRACR|nr:hypothetical protein F2Q70_00032734 [Brassica cretica]